VTFEITFEEKAISRAADFLVDDPEGVSMILREYGRFWMRSTPSRTSPGRRLLSLSVLLICAGFGWGGTGWCTRSERA
jgi:hypothetical protein